MEQIVITQFKDLYRHAKRGLLVQLKDLDYPLTLSWFWLKRAEGLAPSIASPHVTTLRPHLPLRLPTFTSWKAICSFALKTLFPSVAISACLNTFESKQI